MKCVDEEIPFEIPESWEWVRLGSITQHNTGKTLDKNRNTGKLFEYITTSNIYWEGFELDSLKEMRIEEKGVERFTVRKGDLLVCEGGDSGRSAVWEYERTTCFQNHVHRVRPYLSVKSWYIYFFLHKIYLSKEIDQYKKGVGIQSLSGDAFASILLPLPPAKEQQHIVSEIKRCNNFVDVIKLNQTDLQQAVKNVKSKILDLAIRGKLVQQDPNDEPASALLERIKAEHSESKKKAKNISDNSHYENLPQGWVECTLENVGSWSSGATPSRSNKMYYTNGTVNWLKTGDLNDGYVDCIPEKITDLALKECSVRLNPKDSVLIAMYGATIGKIGILNTPSTTNQACCACITYSGIYNKFLFYLLMSQKKILQMKAEGGAQPNISKEKIVNFSILLPPTQEQVRIVQAIDPLFTILDGVVEGL